MKLHLHFYTFTVDRGYPPGATPDAAPVFVRAPEPPMALQERLARQTLTIVVGRGHCDGATAFAAILRRMR